MYRLPMDSSDKADWEREQAGGLAKPIPPVPPQSLLEVEERCEAASFALASNSSNGPGLAIVVSGSGHVHATSSMTTQALTRCVSGKNLTAMGAMPVTPHAVHTDTNTSGHEMNRANLPSFNLRSTLSLCERDNQPYNPAAGLVPSLCERYSAERGEDTTFTTFMINHTTAENEESIVPDDHAFEPGAAASLVEPLAIGSRQAQTRMEVPEMLSRFLRVDRLNDSLRHEAGIAISEGRVQEGEDIVKRKIFGDWKWNIDPLSSTAMALDTSCE